jgi:3-hydroxy-3-methylglutaryl CoA synthase
MVEYGEVCVADIYYALAQEIIFLNQERLAIEEKPLRRPAYSSYAKYFHWFKKLGLVKATERQDPAIHPFLQKRRFYRLTARGRKAVRAWQDPVRTAHPEFSP